ncbi:Procollagen-proline dioxygenase protein [Dioscorea alata]|uniref:Procollagen-proline dioxygenase protein n=1 Tax=Dioscorea alata TaxID=55571 RepID=A0ACB7UN37_DIOAL|nr:Procollagen-proline dioxygenase protein [Dioscorea alata]
MNSLFSFFLLFLFQGLADKHISTKFFNPSRATQLSWHPRIFIYKGFLSDEECEHLIELGKDKLQPSMVTHSDSGKITFTKHRTSSSTFLHKHQDEIVTRIEERIATWTFLPEENGEVLQILHYGHGEKYDPHLDFFLDKVDPKPSGHRVATVLMYLSNVRKGGETVFPYLKEKHAQKQADVSWSDCAKTGYAVKPVKGDALLFFSLHPNTTTDLMTLHGSCPVIDGEKWSATKWIHLRTFEVPERSTTSGKCEDENELCSFWAAAGECTKNHKYMIGSKRSPGFCRSSCNACIS